MRKYELTIEAEPFKAYVQPTNRLAESDTEPADREWQAEVRRNPPAYIRWVQASLNQLLGLNLPVSGVMSAPTRSALRRFQEQQGLPVDGIAGPETEKVLLDFKVGELSRVADVSGHAADLELDIENEFGWINGHGSLSDKGLELENATTFTIDKFPYGYDSQNLNSSQKKTLKYIAGVIFYGHGVVPPISSVKNIVLVGYATGTRNLEKHAKRRAQAVFKELVKELTALGARPQDIAKIRFGDPVTKKVSTSAQSHSEDRKVDIQIIPNPVPQDAKPLTKEAIENFVWALINEVPSDYKWKINLDKAKIFAEYLIAAYTGVASISGPIGPGFFLEVFRLFKVENQEKPYFVRGIAMGMAYAIMDFVMNQKRVENKLKEPIGIPYIIRKPFYQGYSNMQYRLSMIKSHEVQGITVLSRRLMSVDNKETAMEHIYNALFSVLELKEGLQKVFNRYPQTSSMLRFCHFKYPEIKACCGVNPDCRLDL